MNDRRPALFTTPPVWQCGVKDEREAEGLSLRELSAQVPGLNVTKLRRIEAGGEVPLSMAVKLARFFGTTVEGLWFPLAEADAA
jgi:ribosome-binding protein aMBF1 (putative translation factor)